MDINKMAEIAHETSVEKGWHEEPRTPLEIHMLMVSELAEATEQVREDNPALWYGIDGKPEGEAVELADVVIRIGDYFKSNGWNLAAVIADKMAYNKGREHRHGGKTK